MKLPKLLTWLFLASALLALVSAFTFGAWGDGLSAVLVGLAIWLFIKVPPHAGWRVAPAMLLGAVALDWLMGAAGLLTNQLPTGSTAATTVSMLSLAGYNVSWVCRLLGSLMSLIAFIRGLTTADATRPTQHLSLRWTVRAAAIYAIVAVLVSSFTVLILAVLTVVSRGTILIAGLVGGIGLLVLGAMGYLAGLTLIILSLVFAYGMRWRVATTWCLLLETLAVPTLLWIGADNGRLTQYWQPLLGGLAALQVAILITAVVLLVQYRGNAQQFSKKSPGEGSAD